jgi:hypothetical protein
MNKKNNVHLNKIHIKETKQTFWEIFISNNTSQKRYDTQVLTLMRIKDNYQHYPINEFENMIYFKDKSLAENIIVLLKLL